MALEAIIRKSLNGSPPAAGARTAVSDVCLADYEALFLRRTIYSGIRERTPTSGAPLYQRVLGQAWDQLAPEIRQLHAVSSSSSFVGRCTVDRGRNPLSWMVATLIGFPKAGSDQGISVTLTVVGNAERWTRSIGGRAFSSVQSVGRRCAEWLVRERFGAISVDLALVVDGVNLRYIVRRWAVCGIPLPLSFGPRSTAVESVQEGKFRFQVEIAHPMVGLIVRYRGLLALATA